MCSLKFRNNLNAMVRLNCPLMEISANLLFVLQTILELSRQEEHFRLISGSGESGKFHSTDGKFSLDLTPCELLNHSS